MKTEKQLVVTCHKCGSVIGAIRREKLPVPIVATVPFLGRDGSKNLCASCGTELRSIAPHDGRLVASGRAAA